MRRSGANYRTVFLMAIIYAMIAGGCNSLKTSGIDPTGEHVLANPPATAYPAYPNPYQEPPPPPKPWEPVTLILTPSVIAAPVGSEVLLIAGVASADGYFRCNQRLEWSIAPGGVGQFTDIGKNDFVDILLGDYNRPRLINGFFGVGSTASKDEQVKRGPSTPAEEISILPGQGWIKITSPIEGTSTVSVVASNIVNTAQRVKTATIYWTDATWRFPPPAINSAGTKHVFTTTVMRQTNQCPCPGWVVKYTITGGPTAGFSPDGASSVEAITDAAGQANAEIFQKSPAHGTNQIGIEVIRPAELPGAGGQRLTVGAGSTMQTWTAADIALKLSGPSMAKAGETLTYRLEVSNPGDLLSKNIIVSNVLPDGLVYLGGNPAAAVGGKQLQWRLPELGPRQRQTIEVNVRAEKEGSVSNCADVMTEGGLKVSDCATTTITAAAPGAGGGAQTAVTPPSSAASSTSSLIDLKVLGPGNITLLRDKSTLVTFNIIITNRSQTNLNNLLVKDRFDAGLEFRDSENKIINSPEYPLGDLPAGKSSKFDITFRVLRAGNLCHTVEVTRQNESLVKTRACVMVSAQSTPLPGIAPPGGQIPSRSGPGTIPGASPGNKQAAPPAGPSPSAAAGMPTVTIKHTATQPPRGTVGDLVLFNIQIANPNNRPLNNLKVLYRWDPALVPTQTGPKCQLEGRNLMWLFPVLPAGSTQEIQVECKCARVADRASNTVSVSTREGAQAQDTAYLEIRSAFGTQPPGGAIPGGTPLSGRAKTGENQGGENRPGGTAAEKTQSANALTLSVVALHNPVAVGKELTYRICVINNTNAVDRRVTVTAVVPEGMAPVFLGTTGPGPTKFEIDRQTISFNPVMSIQPGETLMYHVRVRTKSASQYPFRFHVELTSQNITQPIVQEAETEVSEERENKKG
jgi:uncharacterized repeat protein (TIGR01451 family)